MTKMIMVSKEIMPPKRSRDEAPKYEDMSRKELLALAKENGISGRLRSADIICRLLGRAPLDRDFVDVFMDEDVFKLHHDRPAVVRPVFVMR